MYLGRISAISQQHLGCISAVSRAVLVALGRRGDDPEMRRRVRPPRTGAHNLARSRTSRMISRISRSYLVRSRTISRTSPAHTISPAHLPISPHISPYLRRISPYLRQIYISRISPAHLTNAAHALAGDAVGFSLSRIRRMTMRNSPNDPA